MTRIEREWVHVSSGMEKAKLHFSPPGLVARAANRFYGWLTALGLGPSYSYLLITTGRKTGRTYSTPVNLLNFEGKLYLVGTRGHTQWSRNAVVSGTVALKKARQSMEFRLRDVPDDEKPKILKAYLSRFNWMVSRFFPLAADSPVPSFGAIATLYPVFELLPSACASETAVF